MKPTARLTLILATTLTAALTLAAAPAITIKATKKTADTDRNRENLGSLRSRQDTYKKKYLELTLTAAGIPPPGDIVVNWAVLIEDVKNRTHLGALGGTQTNFGRARSIEIRTDEFDMEEHSVSRPRGNVERDSEVHAYGIRITDLQGKILADKIEPAKAAAEINEAFDGKLARKALDAADRRDKKK